MTSIPANDLSRQVRAEGRALVDVVVGVAQNGPYVLGPEVEAFEREFATYLGVQHVIGVGNGTDALEIALRTLGVGPGDEVVVASNAGGYSTFAVIAIGAIPVFADVNTHGLVDGDTIAAQRTTRTKAVIVTHLYGQPADAAAIRASLPADVFMIEDCAQSHGARSGQAMTGSIGDIATFSFYPTKNLGCIGDGGALACNDNQLGARIRQLRTYGWSAKYNVDIPFGRNSRLDPIQATVLRLRLKDLDRRNTRRLSIIHRYMEVFPDILGAVIPGSVGHLCVLKVADRASAAAMFAEHGIGTDVHYPICDHQQNAWRYLARSPLPTAERLAGHILTVPSFPELTDAEVEKISETLRLVVPM